ncbi:MAG: hypothetical protein J7501_17000, partial [Bdellovibrio sp.]|nr:hypothetical protein [Bdellovibrio sp.]
MEVQRATVSENAKNTANAEAAIVANELNQMNQSRCSSGGGLVAAKLYCPGRNSALYVPGAAGPVLDENFRKKIGLLQYPNKGSVGLPAKNYHMYMGAYLGCQLQKCGVGKTLSSQIVGAFARTYRKVRLKEKFGERDFKRINNVIEESELNPADPAVEQLGEDTIQYDAMTLYKNGTFDKGTLLDDDLYFKEKLSPSQTRPQRSLCGIPGWSNNRCMSARKKLAEWIADIDWTVASQTSGAEWGWKQCDSEKGHP